MKSAEKSVPKRKWLSHTPPVSVTQYAATANYHVTVCVDRNKYGISGADIGRKGPLTGQCAVALLCAIQHYASIGELSPVRAVVMPDHFHLILCNKSDCSFPGVIAKIKKWLANRFDVVWQRGFFDHRIRNDESLEEQADYVAKNPVRKWLCNDAEEWPFAMRWVFR